MELSLLQWLCAGLVIALGTAIQAVFGFGMAIFAAPFLFLIEPALVPGPVLLCAFSMSVIVAWRHRRAIDAGELGVGLLGRVPGTLIGAWCMTWFSVAQLAWSVAAAVGLAVVVSLLGVSLQPTRWRVFWAAVLSGVMGTTTSIGGPPLALLYQRSGTARLRGTLAGFFTVGSAFSVVALAVAGAFPARHWATAMGLAAISLAAYGVSLRWLHHFRADWVRPGLLVMCGFAAVAAVWRGFTY